MMLIRDRLSMDFCIVEGGRFENCGSAAITVVIYRIGTVRIYTVLINLYSVDS